jgi:uncharacterized pyridoxamine 5'-phosphate oxidase family protein
MNGKNPIEEVSIATNGEPAIIPWSKAVEQLSESQKFWLATVDPDGHPHVVPLFSVWFEGCLYFTSNPDVRKARDLAQNPHCVMTTAGKTLDLVVEGEAVKITDDEMLKRVAEVYKSKYDWPITVENHAYSAPYGAPSAGKPPYELYQVRLKKAFAMGSSEPPYGATRWRFS